MPPISIGGSLLSTKASLTRLPDGKVFILYLASSSGILGYRPSSHHNRKDYESNHKNSKKKRKGRITE
jgi:hypothetical protein